MVLALGELYFAIHWPSPINHANVLVSFIDPVDIQKTRSNQRAAAILGRWWTIADQFHVETAFFLRLAQGCLFGIFVQFDMPAQRQPLIKLAMVDQQHLVFVHNEDGYGEIYLFVNVRHYESLADELNSPFETPVASVTPMRFRRMITFKPCDFRFLQIT